MTTTSALPAWLQGSNKNKNDNGNDDVGDDMEMGHTTTNTNTNANDSEPDATRTSTKAKAARNTSNDDNETNTSSTCSKIIKYGCMVISAILFVLFVASTVVQKNDTGGTAILYLIFYALHAVVAGAYILSHCMCTPCFYKIVNTLAFPMLVWSITLMIISSVQYSKTTPEDDIIEAGGDNPNATKREEIAYEIAGAILGALSTMFHIFMVRKSSSLSS
jgi:hypothetical protein